jgi:hypothetical protein
VSYIVKICGVPVSYAVILLIVVLAIFINSSFVKSAWRPVTITLKKVLRRVKTSS